MGVQKFINAIKQHASLANNNFTFFTSGIIVDYDPTNYCVRVQTDSGDEDSPPSQTGWIPLMSPWIGKGCGMFAAPNLGDLCSVFYQDGDAQVPWCGPFIFSEASNPLPVPSGEFWVVHKSGSFIKITNDGKVLINGDAEIDITTPTLNITVTGTCNLQANAVNLGSTSGLEALINARFENTYNNHTHGGGPIPDSPMPSNNKTVNTKAT